MKTNDISRRKFLKYMGIGAGATMLAGTSCVTRQASSEQDDEGGEMTYRVNPSTGDRVSLLGYGCMRLPVLPAPAGAPENEDGGIDQEEVNRQVDVAIAGGVNYFDTSPAYCKGRSEKAMGEALSRYPRDSYFLATKLSNFDESTWPREKSQEMFENSLKYLRTDYVDYLLLHCVGVGSFEAFNHRYEENGILDWLIEQRQNGRIRNLGFSYHGDIEVFDHALKMHDEGRLKWDFVQIQLNYVDWEQAKADNERETDAKYLYGELTRRGICAVVMEPLLGGRLANVSNNLLAIMQKDRPGDTPAKWAFRYAGTPENILTVLSGMTYMDHLKENLKTFSPLHPLTAEEDATLMHIARLMMEHPAIPCTECQYCMPCPYGIDIPSTFAHYNQMLNEDNIVDDARDPHFAQARKRFLVGYDRKVPRLRQAAHCIGCGVCAPHCPQEIHIPDELHKINAYAEKLRRQA
ncbi:MAG: aldo/keto reductase [Bacteroidales bacterium]|nr:aldo/keto reductase [Bacteroidales bacterium]MCD8393625.1 aldo/keto reductase [Bacteroidales bacterium]